MRIAVMVSLFVPVLASASVLPSGFVENRGQMDEDVLFYTLSGIRIYDDGRISYGDVEIRVPARSSYTIRGEGGETRISFLGGQVFRNLRVYDRVVFEDIHPGVDFVVTPMGNSVEFQWLVHPGGDVNHIALLAIDGEPDFSQIEAFQGSDRVPVSMVREGNLIRFQVAEYDRSRTLVIDPIAFISNDINEGAYGMNVDDSGYVYVTGYVSSVSGMGDWDLFVSRLSPDLSTLLSTAIIYGDSGYYDLGFSIDFDASGNVYVAGWTFDTTSSFGQNVTVYGTRGLVDAFVMKLTPGLDSILSTAIITSPSLDQAFSVYYRNDTVYVGGIASDADNFSASRIIFGTHGGAYDMNAFVSALSGDLFTHYATAVVSSPSSDYAEGIYLGSNRIYVFGYTFDPANFSSDRLVYGATGSGDAFVSVLSSDLSQHLQSVILASDSLDVARSVVEIDTSSFVVAGFTVNSQNFSTDRIIQGIAGGEDIFVTLMDASYSPVSTLVVASPSSDMVSYGSDRALSVADGRILLYGYSDYITAIGGSMDRIMCGTGGGSDAVILWINSSVDSALAMSVPTGDGNDDPSGDMVYRNSRIYFAGSVSGTYDAATYYGPAYSYGTQDGSDVFSGYMDGGCIPVRSMEFQDSPLLVSGGVLYVSVYEPSYVGFDVYTPSGRRVLSRSAGYLLPGQYSFQMNLPVGVYVLKLRIGDRVIERKFIR